MSVTALSSLSSYFFSAPLIGIINIFFVVFGEAWKINRKSSQKQRVPSDNDISAPFLASRALESEEKSLRAVQIHLRIDFALVT